MIAHEEKQVLTRAKLDRVTFGLFEADLRSGELWKAGHRVKLSRQPFRVLASLLEHSGDVVTREDLQREIWGANTNVDFDQAIAASVNKIREALGDSAEDPRYIQTLTKRGYRFIAPVHSLPSPDVQPSTSETEHPSSAPANSLARTEDDDSSRLDATLGLSPTVSPDSVSSPEPNVDGNLGTSNLNFRLSSAIRPDLRMFIRWCCFIVATCAGVLAGRWFAPKELQNPPSRVDQVTHYVPISLGPPNPESFLTTAMGGDHVLTSVLVNGRPRLSAIDVDTAAVRQIEVPEEIAANSLSDITYDGSRLLLRSQQSTESEQPLWVVPSAGGSGRRVPGVIAHDAVWMPDGATILYATGNDLATIGPNEDLSTTFAKLPGRAFWLRWSPDGKLLRFTLFDPVTHAAALWEMASDSHVPTPLSLPQLKGLSPCCGVWLPNGHSYVFQANDNLWRLSGFGRRAKLLQLTNGPLRFLSPVAARSGNRVFFVGLESPSGLQKFSAERKEFVPAPAFLAEANRIDYSRDGRWVAWTDIHEKLWRAHIDGSDKVRLTSDALEVFLAHWSPDGKRLAAMARRPGGVWQIYLVDASGGKAEALLNETRNAADPGWSSDGNSLVFGREPDLMGKESGTRTLQIVNLSSHQTDQIPNSNDLFSPRWSPDGKWIVALTADQKAVMLYDVNLRRWQLLASTSAADPIWSTDSKAIYLHAFLADHEPVIRIDIPSGAVRMIADLKSFHNGEASNYFFGGITPLGEPLVQPRVGTGNLYSIDLKEDEDP